MIQQKLFEFRDETYAAFQAKLIPTVDPKLVIGVRVPVLRKFARQCIREANYEEFLRVFDSCSLFLNEQKSLQAA